MALPIAIACLGGLFSAERVVAQASTQKWTAISNTAMSITGDIDISSTSLTMAGASYQLQLAGNVAAGQLGGVGKMVGLAQPTTAGLYKIKIPATAKLLNGNTVCGPAQVNWLLVVSGANPPADSGPDLALAFFSGTSVPDLAYAVVSNSTSLCGTFSYGH